MGNTTITATAGDVPVSYTVDAKSLAKNTVAGTVLTFTLYEDSGCTKQVHTIDIPVEDVGLVSKLAVVNSKRAPKAKKKAPTSEIRQTLTGVQAATTYYLRVLGNGVVAVGDGCQAQGFGSPVNASSASETASVTLGSNPASVLQTGELVAGEYVALASVSVSRFSSDSDAEERSVACEIGDVVGGAVVSGNGFRTGVALAPGGSTTIALVVPLRVPLQLGNAPTRVEVRCDRDLALGGAATPNAVATTRSLVVMRVGALEP